MVLHRSTVQAALCDYALYKSTFIFTFTFTRDALAALKVLHEKSLEHNNKVYICYVDYEKAAKIIAFMPKTCNNNRNTDLVDRFLSVFGCEWRLETKAHIVTINVQFFMGEET